MEDPDSRAVTNCDKSNAAVFHVGVEMSLNIDRYSTGAFIEDGVLGLVVKEAGHCDTLFFTPGKYVIPIVLGIPSALAGYEVTKLDFVKKGLEIL